MLMDYKLVKNPKGNLMIAKPTYYTGFKNYQILGNSFAIFFQKNNLQNIPNSQKRKYLSDFIQSNLSNEDVFQYLLNRPQRNAFYNNEIVNLNRMTTSFLNGNYNSQRNGWQSLIANLEMRQRASNKIMLNRARETPLPNN